MIMLCLRVAVWRQIINGSNCANRSYEMFLPLALALYDFWVTRRRERFTSSNNDIDDIIYDFPRRSLKTSRFRFIFASLILAWTGTYNYSAGRLLSTYICSPLDITHYSIPRLQIVAFMLDIVFSIILAALLDPGFDNQPPVGASGLVAVGAALIV